jgi:hypothetical protein
MAKSSSSHKSAAYIISIDEPHNFGAVVGPRDNSTRIDQRLIASTKLDLACGMKAAHILGNQYDVCGRRALT